ncbi:MAG: ABC transporter ATP-binding protein [Proteobacteria bacterium]|nr:ABC transporter ATP-binding protein [Pseudomonadota bacterium]
MIRFDRVATQFGGEVVYADLSFAVKAGEFLCLLGPSGCGKSTALRLMGDLLPVNGGAVYVAGGSPRENWNQLAYVFQSPRLVPWRTALGNVALAMELRRRDLTRADRAARARELLDLVGLARDADKYPRMLSGGERQRVAIARALAVEPRIVLMDEPFSALDPTTRARLREELLAVWRKTGKTIVFVTHDVDEALTLADRIILLSAKPTRVLETLALAQQRPRDLAGDAALRECRWRLLSLFARSGPDEVKEERHP